MKRNNYQSGQALVTLLVFMSIAITVTSGAVIATLNNSVSTSTYSLGEETLKVAESGVENAIIRLLRNSSYTGETLVVGNGTATITVSGNTTKVIVSDAIVAGYRRKITVLGIVSNNVFVVSSWNETT